MSSPSQVEHILSPIMEDTSMASIPPPSLTRKEVRPNKPTSVDDDLSVFDIHNIFRRHWFLFRANLLANVISA